MIRNSHQQTLINVDEITKNANIFLHIHGAYIIIRLYTLTAMQAFENKRCIHFIENISVYLELGRISQNLQQSMLSKVPTPSKRSTDRYKIFTSAYLGKFTLPRFQDHRSFLRRPIYLLYFIIIFIKIKELFLAHQFYHSLQAVCSETRKMEQY